MYIVPVKNVVEPDVGVGGRGRIRSQLLTFVSTDVYIDGPKIAIGLTLLIDCVFTLL